MRALESLPEYGLPDILDMGCGSGVPTLALARYFEGQVCAVDRDIEALECLRSKIAGTDIEEKVEIRNNSILEIDFGERRFNIIIAEGLLHIIGFEKGLKLAIKLLKQGGYLIIHDEVPGKKEKLKIFGESGLELVNSFEISREAWWEEYFKCMEKEIAGYDGADKITLFDQDLREIEMVRKDPSQLGSVYYVLQKPV
jgi:SAM-dependent methyltransferase